MFLNEVIYAGNYGLVQQLFIAIEEVMRVRVAQTTSYVSSYSKQINNFSPRTNALASSHIQPAGVQPSYALTIIVLYITFKSQYGRFQVFRHSLARLPA